MDREKLRKQIERFEGLKPPPEVMLRVHELASRSDATISQIGVLVARDPALTLRLLRLANSAYFGFPRRVDTIDEAIMVVGLRNVVDLVSCVAVAQLYAAPVQHLDCRALWLHSCGVAEAARIVSRRAGLAREPVYLAGLLHDVGMVVLAMCRPREYARLVAEAAHQPLPAAERAVLGVDHAWAASVLFEHWQFPESLVEATCAHHEVPGSASASARIVELANALAVRVGLPEPGGAAPEEIRETSLAALDLGPADVDTLLEELEARREALDVLHRETWTGCAGAPPAPARPERVAAGAG